MSYVYDFSIWSTAWEFLENLSILFTLITLFSQYKRDQILELQTESKRGLLFGVILFSLLALLTMLNPIKIPNSQGVVFDLRLSIVVLATSYLGLKGGLIVALFTIIVRSVSGGIGAIWWGGSVFFLVVLAYIVIRAIPSRQIALFTAGVATAAGFIGTLCILALFTEQVNFISPYVSPENFMRFSLTFIIAMPVGVWVLDNTLRNILKFENYYSELKTKANFDGMTGLINYRHFTELFEGMLQSSDTSPLSLLMIDIDHFKIYNDTYGHIEGDDALRKTANVISSCVRQGDVVARYGGEEFVVLLPKTDKQAACEIAERIRGAVESACFPHRKITVSIGISTCEEISGNCKSELLVSADTLMYAAKEAGRNRVGGCE